MIFSLILGIVLGALAVMFALQNTAIVTVRFFSWQYQGSMVLILLLAIATGVLISLLMFLPESITSYFKYRKLQKELARSEEALRKQKELTIFAKTTPATKEELEKFDKGVIAIPMK
jgi:uncharacterized integral membrane protein